MTSLDVVERQLMARMMTFMVCTVTYPISLIGLTGFPIWSRARAGQICTVRI